MTSVECHTHFKTSDGLYIHLFIAPRLAHESLRSYISESSIHVVGIWTVTWLPATDLWFPGLSFMQEKER